MTTVRRERLNDRMLGLVLVLPAFAGLVAFVVWPMIDALRTSFYDRRLTSRDAPFEGFDNWISIAHDPAFISSLGFTAIYAVATVTVGVGLALFLALVLVDRPWLRRIVGPLVLLPTATSLVVAAIGWRFVFDLRGVLNRGLELLGIERINWLDDPVTARLVLVFVGIWGITGFAMLLYQAALSAIPAEVFEAAKVYGRWRGTRNKVVFIAPLVSRTTIVAVVVNTIVALRAFDPIVALTEGGPESSTENLAYLAWQRSFRFYDLGEGSAASTVLVVLVLVITAAELLVLRRLASQRSFA
jgi:multiple sugar transport system permease protein